jgi:hypothetical protein
MAAKKIKDLCVITHSYTDASGKKKNQYENVGHILQMDDGSEMQCLKRTFSPAGVPNPENRDTVILYRFDVKDKNAAPSFGGASTLPASPSLSAPATFTSADMSDDVPF